MAKTIFITGASSGIGRATVRYFSARGWRVAATMRNPKDETELQKLPGVKLYTLDVTNPTSIHAALNQVLTDFGSLEVIVNNAGYGAVGIFEKATDAEIRQQFDTNVFGVMNVIREVLPLFRKQKCGTIINVTSMGGLITFPLYSVYHATKWAVEGFTESLAFEVRPFNIRIKNIEPGAIKTDFYSRSMNVFKNEALADYDNYEKVTLANMQHAGENGPGPEVVAEKIWQATQDTTARLRYPVGNWAPLYLFLRRILPLHWFLSMVRRTTEKA